MNMGEWRLLKFMEVEFRAHLRGMTLTEPQIEMWKNVLRVLQSMNVHARFLHFNLDDWGFKTSCGTTGCVAGLCSLDSWFRANGLYGRWYGKVLELRKGAGDSSPPDFIALFGHVHEYIFYGVRNHAESVRRVQRVLQAVGALTVQPSGYGMPWFGDGYHEAFQQLYSGYVIPNGGW